ncbi:hypothetical protein GCM10025873_05490 [Demequina sediminis]|nr:hypothetical protein GCM10025873_05490 [Demequina sediminis]
MGGLRRDDPTGKRGMTPLDGGGLGGVSRHYHERDTDLARRRHPGEVAKVLVAHRARRGAHEIEDRGDDAAKASRLVGSPVGLTRVRVGSVAPAVRGADRVDIGSLFVR